MEKNEAKSIVLSLRIYLSMIPDHTMKGSMDLRHIKDISEGLDPATKAIRAALEVD